MSDNAQQKESVTNNMDQFMPPQNALGETIGEAVRVPTLSQPPPRRSAAANDGKGSGKTGSSDPTSKTKEKRTGRTPSRDKKDVADRTSSRYTPKQVKGPSGAKTPPGRPPKAPPEETADNTPSKGTSEPTSAANPSGFSIPKLKDARPARSEKEEAAARIREKNLSATDYDKAMHFPHHVALEPNAEKHNLTGSSDPTRHSKPKGSSDPTLQTKSKGPSGPTGKQKPSDAHQSQQRQGPARPYGQAAKDHNHDGCANEPAGSLYLPQRIHSRGRAREGCSTPPTVLTNKSSCELVTSMLPIDRARHTATQHAVAVSGRKREPKGPYRPTTADNATGPSGPVSVKLQRDSSDTTPSHNHDSPAADTTNIASCHYDSSDKEPSGSTKTRSHLRPSFRQPSARDSHHRASTPVRSCTDGSSEPTAGAPDNFPSVLGHFCSTFERHARISSPSSYRRDSTSTSERLQFVRLLDAIKSPRPTHFDLSRFQRELIHICGLYYPTGADITTDVWNGGSVLAKLPFAVRCTLIEHKLDHGDSSPWTLGYLLGQLDRVLHVLREADAYTAKSPQQPSGSRSIQRRHRAPRAPAASSSEHVSEPDMGVPQAGPKKRQCPFCRLKGKHWAVDCPHYAQVSKRYSRIIELNLCIRCLGKDHQGPNRKACKMLHDGSCDFCGDTNHHKALCTTFVAQRRSDMMPAQSDGTRHSSLTRAPGGLPKLSAGKFRVRSDDEHKLGTQPNVGAKDDGHLVLQHGCGKRPSAQEAGAPHLLKASGPTAHRLYDGVGPSREPSGSLVPEQKRLSVVPVRVPSGNTEAASRVHVFVSTISNADFSTRQTRSAATRAIDQRDDTDHMVLTSSTNLLVAEQQCVTDHQVSPLNAASSDTASPRKHHLMLPPTEPRKHHLMLPAPHTDVLPANKNLPSEEAVLEPSGSSNQAIATFPLDHSALPLAATLTNSELRQAAAYAKQRDHRETEVHTQPTDADIDSILVSSPLSRLLRGNSRESPDGMVVPGGHLERTTSPRQAADAYFPAYHQDREITPSGVTSTDQDLATFTESRHAVVPSEAEAVQELDEELEELGEQTRLPGDDTAHQSGVRELEELDKPSGSLPQKVDESVDMDEPSGSPALQIDENTDMDEPYGSLPLNIDEDADLVEPSGSNQPDKAAYVQHWAATAQVTPTEPSAKLREFYNWTFNTTDGRKPHRHDYVAEEPTKPQSESSFKNFLKKSAIDAKAAEYSAKPSDGERHQAGKSPSRTSTTDLSDASMPFKLPTIKPAGAELAMRLFEKYRSKFDLSTPERMALYDQLVAKTYELADDFKGDFAQHYLASLEILQRFVSSDTAKKRDGDDTRSLTEQLQLSDFVSQPSTSNPDSNQVSSDTIEQAATSGATEYQSINELTIADEDGSLIETDEESRRTDNEEELSHEDDLF